MQMTDIVVECPGDIDGDGSVDVTDVLITSQLRTALILNKNVKAVNFNIDTINQKIYVFGIAHDENEKKEIIQEAKQIVDVQEIVTSILMVSDLSRQRE